MRIAHIVPVIAKRYTNPDTRKRAIFLKGKSGIGKSQAVYQASDFLSKHVDNWQGVIDIRLSQCDPTDLRGIPAPEKDEHGNPVKTKWLAPSFLPDPNTSGIIFFDELTSAPPAVQAAAYQYILDRKIGEHAIPDGWMIVAAGNMQSDRGVTFQIAAPLLNRMCEIEVVTTTDDWIDHAIQKDIRPEVLSFIKDRPDLLHKFDPKATIEPFPSPRAWFAVSDALALDLPQDVRVEMIRGDVGYEAATAFEAHLRLYESLPRIDDILAGKDVAVPKDLSAQYCVAMGLAARVSGKTFDKAWEFLQKLPKEIQVLVVRLAVKRDKTVQKTPAFQEWAANNHEAFKLN